MPAPKRIVVVDDDAKVRQLIEYRLRPPEFEFFGFSDGRDALMKLHDIAPDLIVSDIMMPDMDGRLFFQVVKRSEGLQHVPFVFVSAVRTEAVQQAALDAGAKAFFVKPFPISQLVARIRTDLGMVLGAGEPAATSSAMGVTPLPEAESRQPEALLPPPHVAPPIGDAAGPDLAPSPAAAESRQDAMAARDSSEASGPLPETSSDDFFDMLLEEAQVAGEAAPLRVVPSRGGAGQAPPEGRSSTIDVRGKRVHIRTEVRGLPAFAVVTGVMRGDKPIARIETAWEHPLDRIEDRVLVRRQIDLQHHQAVGLVEDLVAESAPRRVLWGSQERSVDAAALCRAMNSICEQLQSLLGAPVALGLLRRSLAGTFQVRRILHCFHIRPDGSVWCDRGTAGVPHDALAAVAAWAWELIVDASRSDQARDLDVRELTQPATAELERIGFYRAFDEVAESHRPLRRPAGVAVRSSFVSSRVGPSQVHDPGPPLAFPEPPPPDRPPSA